jgi:tetratricopeptide (TPR) repeat protein
VKIKFPCAQKNKLFEMPENPALFKKKPQGPFNRIYHAPFAKECSGSKLRAIVIRDSMFTDVEPFFSENFNLILYLWPSIRWKAYDNKFLTEYIEKVKPDVVIEERGERMLFEGISPERFHFNHGTSFLRSGKIQEAVIQFNEVLRLKPDYSKAHYNLGIAMEKKYKPDNAMKHYKKAILIKQDYAQPHNNIGCILFNMNKIEMSIYHFRSALSIRPDCHETNMNLKTALKALERPGSGYCKSSGIDEY